MRSAAVCADAGEWKGNRLSQFERSGRYFPRSRCDPCAGRKDGMDILDSGWSTSIRKLQHLICPRLLLRKMGDVPDSPPATALIV